MPPRLLALVLLALATGCGANPADGALGAKTPDGYTPAVEKVCDIYSGRAFGVCNAYCEAMDCGDPRVHASNRACSVIGAKLEKLTGEPPPCDADEEPPTVDAVDDHFTVPLADCTSIDPLDNDTSSDGARLVLASWDAPTLMTVSDGVFTLCSTSDAPVYESLSYTACHPDLDLCDTATITGESG